MSDISTIVGQRIKNARKSQGMTQETLALLSDCHPTYIGQIERGEKNATLVRIQKICHALKIPMSKLFEKIENLAEKEETAEDNIPLRCYEILCSKPESEQRKLLHIIMEIDSFKE